MATFIQVNGANGKMLVNIDNITVVLKSVDEVKKQYNQIFFCGGPDDSISVRETLEEIGQLIYQAKMQGV